jgi:hypothetical protein
MVSRKALVLVFSLMTTSLCCEELFSHLDGYNRLGSQTTVTQSRVRSNTT